MTDRGGRSRVGREATMQGGEVRRRNLLEQPVRCRVREAAETGPLQLNSPRSPCDCPVGRTSRRRRQRCALLLALSPSLDDEGPGYQQQDKPNRRDDDDDVLGVPVAATRRGRSGKRYQRHSRHDCLSRTAQHNPAGIEAAHHQRPSISRRSAPCQSTARAVTRASPCRRRPRASGPSPCPRPRRG